MLNGSCHCGAVQWQFEGRPDGGVAFWRRLKADDAGRRRTAVNLRLAQPEAVAQIPIDPFDEFDRFDDLPRDGRCVRDYWF